MVLAAMLEELERKLYVQCGATFSQQFLLQQVLKKFGDKGKEAAMKEMDQLDKRDMFQPILIKDLTTQEKAHIMMLVMFFIELI